MEKYKIIQITDSITQGQADIILKVLNDGYFIFAEYKFTNTAVLLLQKEENIEFRVNGASEIVNKILSKKSTSDYV